MEINSLPFEEIEWTLMGEVLPVDKQSIDEWKYIGLNNTSFPQFYDFAKQQLKDN